MKRTIVVCLMLVVMLASLSFGVLANDPGDHGMANSSGPWIPITDQ